MSSWIARIGSLAAAIGIGMAALAFPTAHGRAATLAPDDGSRPALEQRQIECLALNIYWEARSEPIRTRRAIAHVTLNRVSHADYPDTVCEVVRQGREKSFGRCQFSWWCDGRSDRPRDEAAWEDALALARAVMARPSADPTNGALYFHQASIRPKWAGRKSRVGRIGHLIFYR